MYYKKILQQTIDLHVHVGPEIVPRKFNIPELIKYETGKLKGVALKNHFFPTVAINRGNFNSNKFIVIDSVALNNYLGGFNIDAIRASAELSNFPIIVWFPTINAKQFLKTQKYEIPKEWTDREMRKGIKLRLAKNIKGLSVFDKNEKISKEVKEVLEIIKKYNAILATGHISWQEAYKLVKFAIKEQGVKKIIVTHPIYRKINMPLREQKELAEMGAFIECCYSMYSIDKIPINRIAGQIKYVGPEQCILSSDVGQIFSKSPSEALLDFMILLEKEGISKEALKLMLVDNPKRLLFKQSSRETRL